MLFPSSESTSIFVSIFSILENVFDILTHCLLHSPGSTAHGTSPQRADTHSRHTGEIHPLTFSAIVNQNGFSQSAENPATPPMANGRITHENGTENNSPTCSENRNAEISHANGFPNILVSKLSHSNGILMAKGYEGEFSEISQHHENGISQECHENGVTKKHNKAKLTEIALPKDCHQSGNAKCYEAEISKYQCKCGISGHEETKESLPGKNSKSTLSTEHPENGVSGSKKSSKTLPDLNVANVFSCTCHENGASPETNSMNETSSRGMDITCRAFHQPEGTCCSTNSYPLNTCAYSFSILVRYSLFLVLLTMMDKN